MLEQGGTLCTWRAPTDNDEARAFRATTPTLARAQALTLTRAKALTLTRARTQTLKRTLTLNLALTLIKARSGGEAEETIYGGHLAENSDSNTRSLNPYPYP